MSGDFKDIEFSFKLLSEFTTATFINDLEAEARQGLTIYSIYVNYAFVNLAFLTTFS